MSTSSNLSAGLSSLLRLQVVLRLVSLPLNSLILRRLSPEDNGVWMQFQLMTTTVLFLSREGFRRGCLRAKPGDVDKSEQTELNRIWGVSLLPVLVGTILCPLCCTVIIGRANGAHGRAYDVAVALHGFAIWVELLSEPFLIVGLVWLRFGLKFWVEGLATVIRSLVTASLLYTTNWKPESVFSAAQIAFATCALCGYGSLLPEVYRKMKGANPQRKSVLDSGTLGMSMSFVLQSGFKLALAEGSKYVMVIVENRYNQGVFGLVNGLGSLVIRTVFQPIEEAAFTVFSRAGVHEKDSHGMLELRHLLGLLLKAVSLIGLAAVAFGPQNSSTLLRILYSKSWSNTDAPVVLSWYCGYILVLALNGVTEAFVHAVLDARNLAVNNFWMFSFSAIQMIASVGLSFKFGTIGLIMADSLGMGLRICYSTWCIKKYFKVSVWDLRKMLPCTNTLASILLLSSAIWGVHALALHSQLEFWLEASVHIAASGLAVISYIMVIRTSEIDVWQAITHRKLPEKFD